MKKNIFIFFLCVIVVSCEIEAEPELRSIKFVSDRKIEYYFSGGTEGYGSLNASVKKLTYTNGKTVTGFSGVLYTVSGYKGTIKFDKDIPDGTIVEIDFSNSDDRYLFTCTLVK